MTTQEPKKMGRPLTDPEAGPMDRKSITLPPWAWEYLDSLSVPGQRSATLAKIIAQHKAAHIKTE